MPGGKCLIFTIIIAHPNAELCPSRSIAVALNTRAVSRRVRIDAPLRPDARVAFSSTGRHHKRPLTQVDGTT